MDKKGIPSLPMQCRRLPDNGPESHRLQPVTRHITEIIFHIVPDHPSKLVQLVLGTARRAMQKHTPSFPDGLERPIAAQTE